MRKPIFHLVMLFAVLSLILPGARLALGYSMDPDGYGFHEIFMSQLLLAAGLTLIGLFVMAHSVRWIKKRIL